MTAADLHARLRELNQTLERMGASEEYCRTFFDSGAGVCEAHYAGVCVEHRTCVVQLPKGMMCERSYRRNLQYLRKRIEIVEAERVTLKRQWEEFKTQHEAAEGMLSNNEEGMQMAKERRVCLQSQISHQLGELRKLQGERYRLLSGVRPVNAKRFHDELTACLLEKMAILEKLIVGGSEPAVARPGAR